MDGLHVITGATSGIGWAIASHLAERGRQVLALGRNPSALEQLERDWPGRCRGCRIDLTDDPAIAALESRLAAGGERIRALVHCAGVYRDGTLDTSRPDDHDLMFRTNVRARKMLAQALLPHIAQPGGTIVNVASSAGLRSRSGIGDYAASHYAMRALTEAWRQEVNPRGIRVFALYAGRTATPMARQVFQSEGRPYDPDKLLQPRDLAAVIAYVLDLPESVEVTDLSLRPAIPSY